MEKALGKRKMLLDKLKEKICLTMKVPDDFRDLNTIKNHALLSSIPGEKGDSASSKILLDCGCGEGKNVADIESKFPDEYKIVALDVYYPSLTRCQENVSGDNSILQSSGLSLPFRDNTMDVVISNQVIEHIPQYRMYLSEVARVMKPDGFLLVSTPNTHCPKNTFLRLFGHKPVLRWANIDNLPPEEFRGHTQEFNKIEFTALTEEYGFVEFMNMPIQPRPTLKGNWIFNIYTISEFIFFLLSRPFVSKGYSKNINILFKLKKNSVNGMRNKQEPAMSTINVLKPATSHPSGQ